MNLGRTLLLPLLLAILLEGCRAPTEGEEVAVTWGTFGVAETEQLFLVGAEYRWQPAWLGLSPIVGVSVLEDSGTYVYGGARYDLDLSSRWQISPSFAPGIYSGETFDLGGPVEFRSGVDLSYRFKEKWKFAVGIYHLSNGGLYSENGGSEALLFSLVHVF